MSRRLVPVIGLLAGLVPAVFAGIAQAQVNIDQGKSPAEMFANDCATCHKGVRGLAAGKNSLMLSSFLREHYTASREEASSLAAYVLGAGGGEAAPKGEPKPGRPATASAKTEETPATAKPQRPSAVDAKREEPANPPPNIAAPEPPATASVTPQAAPAPATPVIAAPAANAAPASMEAPSVEFSPTKSAAAPAEGDNAPVPRDNIPD